jgi:VWFA-related protein
VIQTRDARRFITPIGFILLISMALLVAIVTDARSQIRVSSDLVLVPVTARNADDEFVTGMTKGDFTVLEDGKVQEITSFDDEPRPLSAAVVIDDGVGGGALNRVASKLDILAAGFTPEDEFTVFRYSGIVDQLSDFSNDPKVMLKSFVVISKMAEGRPLEQQELITGGPGWLRSVLGVFPDGSKGTAKNHVIHNAIYESAVALQGRSRERRKVVMIVSEKDNIDFLLKNEIQVFAVSTDHPSFGSYGTLSTYANATGGDVHAGATDETISHAFNQITQQPRHQYVLGYVSTNTSGKPGAFRKIEVRTRELNLKLSYRNGYTRLSGR